MKNFKLENITLEVSTVEVLKIKEALEWYRDTRLDRINIWSESDEDVCQKCFGMSHEEKNREWKADEEKRINEMCKVLWSAYMGYPFKD